MSLGTSIATTKLEALLAGQDVPDDLLRWIANQRRAARELVFREAGTDATGGSLFEVGLAHDPRVFAAKSTGVRIAWLLIAKGAAGVSVAALMPGRSSGAEAVRQSLHRARAEIERYSPDVAAELCRVEITRDVARYCRTAASPQISTNAIPICPRQQAVACSVPNSQTEPRTQ
jgi:hypothetical protein